MSAFWSKADTTLTSDLGGMRTLSLGVVSTPTTVLLDEPMFGLKSADGDKPILGPLGCEYRPPLNLACLELSVDIDDVFERKLGDVRVNASISRHGDDFHQFEPRAAVRRRDNRPIGRAHESKIVVTTAQSDQRPCAVAPEQFDGEVKRRTHFQRDQPFHRLQYRNGTPPRGRSRANLFAGLFGWGLGLPFQTGHWR